MSLSTQTWRVSAKYNISSASSTVITQLEMIIAIKAMFDAEDVIGSSSWSYVAADTTAGYIILKRKGSPSGTLASFRAIIFGHTSNTAHSSNLLLGAANTANQLYVASSEDGANNTIANAWTAGAALTGKYVPGTTALTASFGAGSSSTPKVFMIDSDEVCYIFVTTSNNTNVGCMIGVGAVAEKFDGTAVWGYVHSRGTSNGQDAGTEGISTSGLMCMSGIDSGSSSIGSGGYYDNSAARALGRINAIIANSSGFTYDGLQDAGNSYAVLMPILLGSKSTASGPVNYTGLLRQARMGPRVTAQVGLKNAGGTTVAYAINAGYNALGHGLVLDTVA